MAMPTRARRWTAAEVRHLMDQSPKYGPRYELIDGELLVSAAPAPRHQIALSWLYDRLNAYVHREHLGNLLWSPSDLELEQEQITQPDLFVIPAAIDLPIQSWAQVTRLWLAVEVLSPSTAKADRTKKRAYYQRVGVPEYWIVDLDSREIQRWRPSDKQPDVYTRMLNWHPVVAMEQLEIDLTQLWQITARK